MTTRNIVWALTWEYWRRGTIGLVLAAAGLVIACTGLFYTPLLLVTGLRYSDLRAELDMGLVVFIMMPPVALTVASFAASRRYHVLPIPTALYVLCTLANGALATMLIYWTIALVLGSWLHADWPLLAPAAWAATAYVWLQSLAWQAGRSRGLFIVLMGLFLGFAMQLGVDYLLPNLRPLNHPVGQIEPRIVSSLHLAIAPIWVLAYFLAVNGVARDRRGDGWSLAWLARVGRLPSELLAQFSNRGIASDRPARTFHSPQAAQFWYEWHTKGRFVLRSVLAILAGLLAWMGVTHPNLDDVGGALGGLGGMCVLLTPLIGLYLGSDAGRFDRRVFSATRPLSDGAMASAVLKNVSAVVCSCSAAWLLGIVVAFTVFRPHDVEWQQLQRAWSDGPLSLVREVAEPTRIIILLDLLLGIWTAVGLCAALALARSWFVCVGGVGFAGLIVALFLTARSGVRLQVSLPAICLLGTLTAYTLAYRLRVISRGRIITCCVLYLLLCLAYISAHALAREGYLDVYNQLIAAGICAAPFAPLPVASCALSWNRHR